MDVFEAIEKRASVRSLKPADVSDADLDRILDAGRRSGSSKNEQNWDFIVCTNREHLQELTGVGQYAAHLAGAAAAVALVVPDPATHEAPYSIMWDLGRAAQNMTLAAWELGIGSVPATVYDQPLARRLLGYPDDYWCEFLLSFGYPLKPEALTWAKRAGGRKPLEAIVHYERW
jgi:nitroreductase